MKSSPNPIADKTTPERTPLTAYAGAPDGRPPEASDPIAAWIDLMEAVEALCPQWPEREIPVGGNYYL